MTPTPSLGTPSIAAAMPRWERWVGWLLLAAFVVAGLNHVHAKTIFGQDFYLHMKGTENMLADPGRWFPQDFTNRPMLYALGCFGHWLTHHQAPYETAGTICVFMNTLALGLLHATTRRFIASPWLRLAVVSFVAFLPSTEVASVVYAGDATAQLPFALTAWALLCCFESTALRTFLGYAVVTGLALTWGNFCRFPFISLPLALVPAVLLAWRGRRLSWQRSLLVLAIAGITPVATGLWINHYAAIQLAAEPKHHAFRPEGAGDMTWNDLLVIKPSDKRIFDAPGYWDNEVLEGALHYGLPFHENYSYPALCLLSVYTDVLDYANDGQLDNGAPRPEPQKTLSKWSVRLGLITAAGILVSVLIFVFRSAATLVKPRFTPSNGTLIWGMMALAWYLPLVLSFPYLENVYDWGYWLSRLIIPAIWGFSLLLFAQVDQWLAGRPRWIPILIAGLIFAQSAMHFRSVWYWITY